MPIQQRHSLRRGPVQSTGDSQKLRRNNARAASPKLPRTAPHSPSPSPFSPSPSPLDGPLQNASGAPDVANLVHMTDAPAIVAGPLQTVSGVGNVLDQLQTTQNNPAEVASIFLQCMLVRATSRPLGQKMVAKTLHSACKTGGGGGGAQEAIRAFTTKQLQVLGADPNTVRALVFGTTPDTQYKLPTAADASARCTFHVARVTAGSSPSSSSTGFSFNSLSRPDPNASPTCDVHFVCSGAPPTHSATRFVRLQLEKGGSEWRVRDFSDLMKPVVAPARWKSDEDRAAEAAAAAAEAAAAAAAADAYRPIARSTGGTGLNKPLFGGGLTRWRKNARESTAERTLRQQVAKADTKGLARRLSAAELNRKFAANPQARVIVDMSSLDGMVRTRTLKKGELFDKAVGFKVVLETVQDAERQAAEAKAAAEKGRIDRHNKRIQQAIAGASG